MTYIVDQLYPPINKEDEGEIEYTSFNYWRDPVSDFELPVESGSSPIPDAPNTVLQNVQSKPLPTIPEN